MHRVRSHQDRKTGRSGVCTAKMRRDGLISHRSFRRPVYRFARGCQDNPHNRAPGRPGGMTAVAPSDGTTGYGSDAVIPAPSRNLQTGVCDASQELDSRAPPDPVEGKSGGMTIEGLCEPLLHACKYGHTGTSARDLPLCHFPTGIFASRDPSWSRPCEVLRSMTLFRTHCVGPSMHSWIPWASSAMS